MEDIPYLLEQQLNICDQLIYTNNRESNNNRGFSATEAWLKHCQIYLTFRLYRKALLASESVLQEDPTDFKALGYKIRSLFGLGKYQESITFLTKSIKSLKTSPPQIPIQTSNQKFNFYSTERHIKLLNNYLKDARMLLEQQTYGAYDMAYFVPNRKIHYDNIPEYKGPIKIATIEGKGRGVIATSEIQPGQLLLASRAFEIVFEDHLTLEMAVAQKLSLDPEFSKEIYQLTAGAELGWLDKESGKMSIDMERITGICTMNSFGNSRNLTGYGHDSRGLWLFPSYFNHDCIDFNCTWKVLGDFIFIRALKHIPEGGELLISYTDSAESLEERLKFFQAHDFICQCRLCQLQSQEEEHIRQRRVTILESVDQDLPLLLKESDVKEVVKYVENCVNELDQMGKQSEKPEWNFTVHLALDTLTKLYLKVGDLRYKDVAERYYKVVNGSGDEGPYGICLEIGAAGQVASVFLKAGDIQGASKWIEILKKDLALVYGQSNVFKLIYPVLYAQAIKNGISC